MTVSVRSEIMTVVQTVIRALGLTYVDANGDTQSLPSAQVYRRKVLSDRDTELPCVIIAYGGRLGLAGPGTFEQTELEFPTFVAWLFASDQSYEVNEDALVWEEAIIDAFLDLPREEVEGAGAFDCRIDTSAPVDLSLFLGANLDVGGALLKFTATKDRPVREARS